VSLDVTIYGRTLVCSSAFLVPFPLGLSSLYLCPSFPSPRFHLSPFSTLLRFFELMTRLLSDMCYFGLTDGIPDPTATGGPISKAIANSSIISCRPDPGLTSLPDDVLLLMISLIGVEDILALRMVCTHDLDSTQSALDLKPLHRHRSALYRSPSSAGCGRMRSSIMS
jgi:hypothetical protein